MKEFSWDVWAQTPWKSAVTTRTIYFYCKCWFQQITIIPNTELSAFCEGFPYSTTFLGDLGWGCYNLPSDICTYTNIICIYPPCYAHPPTPRDQICKVLRLLAAHLFAETPSPPEIRHWVHHGRWEMFEAKIYSNWKVDGILGGSSHDL